MKNILSLVIMLSVFFSTSCKKNNSNCKEEVTGIVRDYTGKLDGCTMMIELTNGGRLEVHSLPLGITLVDGKKVAVKYTVNNQAVSICMAGTIANITSLRYL
jgi:hypothetical protein